MKKETFEHTPKQRTSLIQKGENDVRTHAPEAALNMSKINNDGTNNSLVPFGLIPCFVCNKVLKGMKSKSNQICVGYFLFQMKSYLKIPQSRGRI